jgi:hypothetical protein
VAGGTAPGRAGAAAAASAAPGGELALALPDARGAGPDSSPRDLDTARDSAPEGSDGLPDKSKAATEKQSAGKNPFKLLQEKLWKARETSQSLEAIEKKQDELGVHYQEYMKHLLTLWDPPASEDQATEHTLRELQGHMEGSIVRTLKRLGIGEEYPSLDLIKIHDEFKQRLYLWEDMLWCLQQQPCYLARLGKKLGDEDFFWPDERTAMDLYKVQIPAGLFVSVVKSIFWELHNTRTRTLFLALVRRLMQDEVEKSALARERDSAGETPDPDFVKEKECLNQCITQSSSKVSQLMCFQASHRQLDSIRKLHQCLFDIDEPRSLVNKIFQKTLGEQSEDLHLKVGDAVVVDSPFLSGNEEMDRDGESDRAIEVSKGLQGKVEFIDGEGDALIDFGPKGAASGKHWVFSHEWHRLSQDETQSKSKQKKVEGEKDAGWLFPHVQAEVTEYYADFSPDKDVAEMSQEQFRRAFDVGVVGLRSLFGFSSSEDAAGTDDGGLSRALGDARPKKSRMKKFASCLDWESLLKPQEIKATLFKMCGVLQEKFKNLDLSMDDLNGDIKANTMTKKEKVLYEPIAKFWIGSVLGHIVANSLAPSSPGCTHAIMPLSYKNKVLRKLEDLKPKIGDKLFNDKDEFFYWRRFEFNMRQVGKFLQNVAYCGNPPNDFAHTMRPDVFPDLRETASEQFAEWSARQIKKLVCFSDKVKDTTDSQLTIDLYTSHYDVQAHHVRMDTVQLLQLSNALWIFRDEVSGGVTDRDGENGPYHDMLLELLRQIQPREGLIGANAPKDGLRQSDKDSIAKTSHQIWDKYAVAIAEKYRTHHNFEIRHRFIENHQDICFCRECQSPIIRAISPKIMRGKSDVRLITIFKDYPGRTFDSDKNPNPFYPLKALETVLEALKTEIKAQDFSLMTSEFSEKQNDIVAKLSQKGDSMEAAEQYEIVAKLEMGKRALEILKNYNVNEKEFIEHELNQMERRKSHMDYLESLEKQKLEISKSRTSYQVNLKSTLKFLEHSLHWSERAPKEIQRRAQEFGTQLKVQKIEAIKKKEERSQKTTLGIYPSATYTVGKLRAKKVISRLDRFLPNKEHKAITFVFSMMDSGSWNIVARYQEPRKGLHTLCSFEISGEEVDAMKKAKKCAHLPFANGFVWINCFPLVQLLARISALQPEHEARLTAS